MVFGGIWAPVFPIKVFLARAAHLLYIMLLWLSEDVSECPRKAVTPEQPARRGSALAWLCPAMGRQWWWVRTVGTSEHWR